MGILRNTLNSFAFYGYLVPCGEMNFHKPRLFITNWLGLFCILNYNFKNTNKKASLAKCVKCQPADSRVPGLILP